MKAYNNNTTVYFFDQPAPRLRQASGINILIEKYKASNWSAFSTSAVYSLAPGVIGHIISVRKYVGSSTTDLYYHYDPIGNVQFITDGSGNIAASYVQEGFGNVLATNGSLTSNNYHLTTKEQEPETALYYFYARWYDSAVGRFITKDRGYKRDYLYCRNNPIKLIDPCGADPIDDLFREIGKIIAEQKGKVPLLACADAIRKLHQEGLKPRETKKECKDGKEVDVEIVGSGGPCTEYGKGNRNASTCMGCYQYLADVVTACMLTVPDPFNTILLKALNHCLTYYP